MRSQPHEIEVAEGTQQAVMVVENHLCSGNLLQPVHHHPDHLWEVALSSGHMAWIDVHRLQGREEQFAWAGIVAAVVRKRLVSTLITLWHSI